MPKPMFEFSVSSHERPRCPQCREVQTAAIDATRNADGTAVRNLWSCDFCGYAFQTVLQVEGPQLAA